MMVFREENCALLAGRKQAATVCFVCCGDLAVCSDVGGVMRVACVQVEAHLQSADEVQSGRFSVWSEKSLMADAHLLH